MLKDKNRTVEAELALIHKDSLAAFAALPALSEHMTTLATKIVYSKLKVDVHPDRADWAQGAAILAMDLYFTYGNQTIEENRNADKEQLAADQACAIAATHMIRRANEAYRARLQILDNWNAGEDTERDTQVEAALIEQENARSEWLDNEFVELHDWDKANYRDPGMSGDIAREVGRAALVRLRKANVKLYDIIVWSTYIGELAWHLREGGFKQPEVEPLAKLMGRHSEGASELGGPKRARIKADIDLAFASLKAQARKIMADLYRDLGVIPSVWTEEAKRIAEDEQHRGRMHGYAPVFGPVPPPGGLVKGKFVRPDWGVTEELIAAYPEGTYISPKREEFYANAAPTTPASYKPHDKIKGVSLGMPFGITHGGIGDSKGATAKKYEVRKPFDTRPKNEHDGRIQDDEALQDLETPVIPETEEIRTAVFGYELTSIITEAEMVANAKELWG